MFRLGSGRVGADGGRDTCISYELENRHMYTNYRLGADFGPFTHGEHCFDIGGTEN